MTDEQLKTIGEYTCVEIARNRNFRRQVEKLPLGMHILYIIDHPNQFQDKPKSRFKRFVDWVRNVFNSDYKLYGSSEGKPILETKK